PLYTPNCKNILANFTLYFRYMKRRISMSLEH
ncbi:MAG: hypothetical protein ACI8ZF_001042, partial [Candidatus Midichloriaceae bacterium]